MRFRLFNFSILCSLVLSCPMGVADDNITVKQIKKSLELDRGKITAFIVEFEVKRLPDEKLKKSKVLPYLGGSEQQTCGFSGSKRFCDFSGNISIGGNEKEKYLAVFDGQKMYKRQDKFITISSLKSSLSDQNPYLSILLWPISDPDIAQLKEPAKRVPFLPRMLDSNWDLASADITVGNHLCVELVEKDKSRRLLLGKQKGFVPVEYSFEESKTGKGFGRLECSFSEFKKTGGLYFPYKAVASMEVYELNTKKLAGVLVSEFSVKRILANDDVSPDTFSFRPSPGDTVVNHDDGTMQTYSDPKNKNNLANSVVEAKSYLASSNAGFMGGRFSLLTVVLVFAVGFVLSFVIALMSKRSRSRTTAMLFGLVILIQTESLAVSQDKATSDETQAKTFKDFVKSDSVHTFFIRLNGTIGVSFRPSRRYVTPLPLLKIISRDDVTSALDIVEEQAKRLDQIKTQLEKAIQECEALIVEAPFVTAKMREVIVDKLSKPTEKANSFVDDLLVPSQIEQLKKMFLIFQIRRVGLYPMLANGSLSKELEITEQQKKSLKSVLEKQIENQKKQILKLKEDAKSTLTEALPKKHVATIRQLVEREVSMLNLPLSVFAAQLDSSQKRSMIDAKKKDRYLNYYPLAYGSTFRVEFDGRIFFVPQNKSQFVPEVIIPDQLFQLLMDEDIQFAFELSDEQRQALGVVGQWNRDFFKEKTKALNLYVQQNGWDNLKTFQETWLEQRKQFGNRVMDRIEAILLRPQKQLLKNGVRSVSIVRLGFIQSLRLGTIDDIKLTGSELDRLEKASKSVFEDLVSESKKIEQKLNRELLQELRASQKREFMQLTDNLLEIESGNLELQSTFANPEIVEDLIKEAKIVDLFLPSIKQ